ncbi:MAG: SLC26A/SulP transporter family protein [Ilumatobacter sp.]
MHGGDEPAVEVLERPTSTQSLVTDVVGTTALVLYSITTSVSFAALVFAGAAADGLPRGASTFLFASGLITLVLGLRTRFPVAFGVVQATASIVLVPAVAAVASAGSDDVVRDVFVVLGLSSLLTGFAMWSMGRARLAGLARFMPTTVVAGFLAGTGWLLVKGGIDVMTRRTIGLGDVGDLVDIDLAKLWLPGVALGLGIAVVPLVPRLSPVVSGMSTVVATVLFYAVVASSSSFDAVEAGGWLLGPYPEPGNIQLVAWDVRDADWSAVARAAGPAGVVVILSILGVLLNVSGVQSLLGRRIDVDAELRTVGLANLAIAPFGGLVGYHGLGDSALAQRLGLWKRWSPIAVGCSTMVFAFLGASAVGLLPRFVAGGLLIGAGFGLFQHWVGELRATTSAFDRAVSVVILVTIAVVGILEGIVVGIVAACLFFVVRYSRIDAVRMVSTGLERRSVVERSVAETDRLDALAGRLVVYELHGSLFFGSVAGVAATVRDRLDRDGAPVDVIVLDLGLVNDIDSSAFTALVELAADIDDQGARLIWSRVPDDADELLRRAGAAVDGLSHLDAALEVAEDHVLAVNPLDDETPVDELATYSAELLAWFSTRHLEAGQVLMREGDPSDVLAVVMDGEVRVTRIDRDGAEIRLRTLRAGAILGEIGFLTGEPRSATVTAATPLDVRVLDFEAHRRLRAEQPELLIELYDRVLKSSAELARAIHRSLAQALR